VHFGAPLRGAVDKLAAYPGLPPWAILVSSLRDEDCSRRNVHNAFDFVFKCDYPAGLPFLLPQSGPSA
jgi:hypothetical protein